MSNWEKRNINFKTFIKKEQEIFKQTKKAYKYESSLLGECIDLHFNSIGYTFDLLYDGNTDLFYDAFIRLGIKILHNTEAIRNLINLGLFGSASIIYRTLIFDTHMIWYLYFNPHLIEDWSKEKFITSKDREWRDKFSEKAIIDNLKAKGEKYRLFLDYETDFVFYSKVAHPSYFGIRFFQNKNGELSYLPEFNMEVGHLLFIRTLGLLPYPTQVLLEKNRDKIKKKESKILSLQQKYNNIMPTLNNLGLVASKFHKEVLGAKNARDIVGT